MAVTRNTRILQPGERTIVKKLKAAAYVDLAREINRDTILSLVRQRQPIFRVGLARASGLQNSTVSLIIEELLAEGWISEHEAPRAAGGRRLMQISLNSCYAMLVAVVRSGQGILAAVDLQGRVLQTETILLPHEVRASAEILADALLRLRARHPRYTFDRGGVCLPTGDPVPLSRQPSWNDEDNRALLADRLGMPVELVTDASAFLQAELWFGKLNGVKNIVLIAVSASISASVLVDGNLVSGRLNLAGELGHICVDPQGCLCPCGRKGCWETIASSSAALRHYAESAPVAPGMEYPALTRLAHAGDLGACAAIQRQAHAIGRILRVVTAALDPQVILFAGEIGLAWPIVLPFLERAASDTMLAGSPPRLASVGNAVETLLRGTAAVILQRHSSYYRSRSASRAANLDLTSEQGDGMSVAENQERKSSRVISAGALPSSEATREVNRDQILERIRILQPISRVDLARASGLQPSTISSIVEQLLKERWVKEGALVKTARGRRPTLLSLNDDLVFLVADVRPSRAVVALVDLSGRFLERQLLPLGSDPERSLASIAEVMLRFRDHHPDSTLEGVGLSMPGRVDPATNKLLLAPNMAWVRFPIGEFLGNLLGMNVQLENAANASLLSELWFGRVGVRDAMLVTVSEGVGVAVLADGHLVHGKQGIAGEFGHICVDPAGLLCSCGAHGCWELYASSRAALRYYRELSPGSICSAFVDLMALAIDGDKHARNALEQQAHAIGRGLHLLNAVLAPEVILLAGDLTSFYEMYREILEGECRAGALDGIGPVLRSIGDGEIARLRGAAAVVLQRHSGYYRASHKRL